MIVEDADEHEVYLSDPEVLAAALSSRGVRSGAR